MSDVSQRYTFDSEPLLAFFLNENGADEVENLLRQVQSGEAEGYISIINLTEISYILSRVNVELAEETERNLRLLGLNIVPVEDNGLWRQAGNVKAKHSLSLADAFAVATAEATKSKLVVGSDKEFRELKIQIRRIRQSSRLIFLNQIKKNSIKQCGAGEADVFRVGRRLHGRIEEKGTDQLLNGYEEVKP